MTARRTERAVLAVALAAAVAAAAAPHGSALAADNAGARPFVARYTIIWHGVSAGSSTLELRETAAQLYLYTSTDSSIRLLPARISAPVAPVEPLRIAAGEVEPLDFQTGGAGNDVMAQFDWKIGHVTGMAKGKLLDLKLQPGTQDPLSVQIAIMLKLQARDAAPDAFWMLNSDEIDRFQYVRHEETTLDTPLGKLHTILYTSHKPGSDKTTYLWLAPALDYMPARAEQHVKGDTQVSLEIRAFARK